MATDSMCPVCTALTPPPGAGPGPAIGQPITWSFACRRCGNYRISESDRTALLERIPFMHDPYATDDWTRRDVDPRHAGATGYPIERMHLLAGYLRELTIAGHGGITITGESARAMADAAPRSVPDRTNRLLLNLAAMNRFAGERQAIFGPDDCSLAYGSTGGELMFLLRHLMEAGLLDSPPVRSDPPIFDWVAVSLKGWTEVERLRSRSTSFTQAFVAMTFDASYDWIYTSAIAPAVREAGYEPLILSKQEHADRVDERIVLELNRSRFVVAEFTQHRPSVYFEAGYAVGRGLPVIWACRAEDYGHAHFDTRQYNHIVWKDAEELKDRLFTRIKVLVG